MSLELLSGEIAEISPMPLAISLMILLSPDEVKDALTEGLALLESPRVGPGCAGRVAPWYFVDQVGLRVVLDEICRSVVLDAQIVWLSALLADLASGEITWSAERIAEVAKAFEPS